MTIPSIESPEVTQILQQLTVKVISPIETGSGIIYKPEPNSEYIYILTARHVLLGEGGLAEEIESTQISIDFLYIGKSDQPYGNYQLDTEDQVLFSDPGKDFSVIVISTSKIELITGVIPPIHLVKESFGLTNCIFRGFPGAYQGDEPISMDGIITESTKTYSHVFEWEVTKKLADRWISQVSRTAYENVEGFSGSGVFLINGAEIYLFGIVSKFGPFNRFLGKKVILLEEILPAKYLPVTPFYIPETRPEIRVAIQRLKDSALSNVVKRISNQIGNTWHLPRETFEADFAKKLEDNSLTIVFGEAGAGKSAAVKKYLIENNCHLIAFKGEQLCRDNLYTTLNNIGIQENFETILCSPLLSEKVIIWIDGAEKCVERNQFEAMFDLLLLTESRPDLKIVITIRKYALEHFRILALSKVANTAFQEVELLTDDDLDKTLEQFPNIAPLLSNKKLRHLLRVPFYLNYAVALSESNNEYGTLDEFNFKKAIWTLIIDKGDIQRSMVFSNLALNRAEEMALYVKPEVENWEKINALEHDQVVVRESTDSDRYAPAHDIFEDWAIVRFVRTKYNTGIQPEVFFKELGTHYAIRRGFRFWLQEELERQPEEIVDFASKCLMQQEVDQYWKDEVFITCIQSEKGPIFLDTNQAILLKDNGRLLLRFIHLFRTACKAPLSIPSTNSNELWKIYSDNYLPFGHGWSILVKFISTRFDQLENYHAVYYFIKDWSNKLRYDKPLPEESRSAGLILFEIFERSGVNHRSGFHHNDNALRKKTLHLIFRLSEVIKEEVEILLNETLEAISHAKANRNRLTGIYDLVWTEILNYFRCNEICLFFPDLILQAAWEKWVDNVPKKPSARPFEYRREDENQLYGLVDRHRIKSFPSSAYKTPLLRLFFYSPTKVIVWFVNFLNYVTEKYVQSIQAKGTMISVQEIEVILNDGRKIKKWGNHTIYATFRGSSAGVPDLLESMLMALEKWLFELAQLNSPKFNGTISQAFDYILENSKTVATTAVLISFATAYPDLLKDKIFSLLRTPVLYIWDLNRLSSDMTSHLLNPRGADEYGLLYQKERHKANQMAHRKLSLENLVKKQLNKDLNFREQMFSVFDHFWEHIEMQDAVWSACLARLDFRKWEKAERIEIEGKHFLARQPIKEEDLANLSRSIIEEREVVQPINNANYWSLQMFEKKEVPNNTFEVWVLHYQNLSKLEKVELDGYLQLRFPPALLSAVGIRDFPNHLDKTQLLWCETHLMKRAELEVKESRENDFFNHRIKNDIENIPTLLSLVLLLRNQHDPTLRPKVIRFIFESLLAIEMSNNLKNVFFVYVKENLWDIDRAVAYNCWLGLIHYADLRQNHSPRTYDNYSNDPEIAREIEVFEQKKIALTESVIALNVPPIKLPSTLDEANHWWLDKALAILPINLSEPEYKDFLQRMLELYFNELVQEDKPQSWSGSSSISYNFGLTLSKAFAAFILNQPTETGLPLFDQLIEIVFKSENYQKEIFEFINSCLEEIINILAIEPDQDSKAFAFYWKYLLDKTLAYNNPYFVTHLLLESPYWLSHVTNWKPIVDNKVLFSEIIQSVGIHEPNSVVRLLGGIGSEPLLPEGISWLHAILQTSGVGSIKMNDMEKLLSTIWVTHTRQIKQNQEQYRSLVDILDMMVEKGSSLAFYMRESLFGA